MVNKIIRVTCQSENETKLVGQKIGELLKAHDLVEIIGDIGAGKTSFVKGLAKGIGSDDHVTSPTFTVAQIYSGRIKLHHLDLYRLDKPELIEHQIDEAFNEPDSAVAIEWSQVAEHVLPRQRYKIEIKVNQDESRNIIIDPPKLDLREAPTTSDLFSESRPNFSAGKVSKDTSSSDKTSPESPKAKPEDGAISRKASKKDPK